MLQKLCIYLYIYIYKIHQVINTYHGTCIYIVVDVFAEIVQWDEDAAETMPTRTIFLTNINSIGYYRAFYDEQTWRDITRLLITNHQVS